MALGARQYNPYLGNPYIYGQGPEHNWFIDAAGNVVPAPQQPPAPLPLPNDGADKANEISPSIFEGDGAQGGDAYEPGFSSDNDRWPDVVGPSISDVMAALAADRPVPTGQMGDIRGYTGQPMESAPPAGWGDQPSYSDSMMSGYGSLGGFADDVGMMADRAAEESVLGDRAMTRAHEFDEPTSMTGATLTDQPSASAAPAAGAPNSMDVGKVGGVGIGVGTDLRGWGETVGGTNQGSLAGFTDGLIGAMGGGVGKGGSISDQINSPGGRAALSFAEGMLSRSPDQFTPFGERADLTGKSSLAGTVDQAKGYVDPNYSAPAAPASDEYVVGAPSTEQTVTPGYSPGPAAPSIAPADFLDLLDLDQTPVIDPETLTPTSNELFSFDAPPAEAISQDMGALGLVGVDEDMLGSNPADLVHGGYGTDDFTGGLSHGQITDMYNDPNIGVGQKGFAGGTLIGDLQRAIEMIDEEKSSEPKGGYADDLVVGGYGMDTPYTGDTGGSAPGGYANRGGWDKGSTPGQENSNNDGGGGGSDPSGAPGDNGQDAASDPGQDSTGGIGAGNSGNTGSGGCYLTTAAVDHMGLPDNGPHLQTLRWYRDKVMRRNPKGRKLIAEYNRIAPKAVKALNGRKDAKEVYRALFSGYIDPAAKAITEGKYDDADAIYGRMVTNVADITGVK